jgi:hypothetical protein
MKKYRIRDWWSIYWFRTGPPEVAISDTQCPLSDIRCLIAFTIKSPSSRHPILAESDFHGHYGTTARHEKISSPRFVEGWIRTGRPEVAISDIDCQTPTYVVSLLS